MPPVDQFAATFNSKTLMAKGQIRYPADRVESFCALVLQVDDYGKVVAAAGEFVDGANVSKTIKTTKRGTAAETTNFNLQLRKLRGATGPFDPRRKATGVAFYVRPNQKPGSWFENGIKVT